MHALLCHYSVSEYCSPAKQTPHPAVRRCTTDHFFWIAVRFRDASFFHHLPPFSSISVFFLTLLFYSHFHIIAISVQASPFPGVLSLLHLHSFRVISVLGCAIFISLCPFSTTSVFWCIVFAFSTSTPSVLLGRFSIPSSREYLDALRTGSARHSYVEAGALLATSPVPATGSLCSVLWAAVSHPATKPLHLPS